MGNFSKVILKNLNFLQNQIITAIMISNVFNLSLYILEIQNTEEYFINSSNTSIILTDISEILLTNLIIDRCQSLFTTAGLKIIDTYYSSNLGEVTIENILRFKNFFIKDKNQRLKIYEHICLI